MSTPTLTKTRTAEAAVAAYRIVKHGAADYGVVVGAAATDLIYGVNDSLAMANGERGDIVMGGIAEVEYGGTVARGDMLTSDGTGRAIATTTATNRCIGVADVSGVVGDIGSVQISPCLI